MGYTFFYFSQRTRNAVVTPEPLLTSQTNTPLPAICELLGLLCQFGKHFLNRVVSTINSMLSS